MRHKQLKIKLAKGEAINRGLPQYLLRGVPPMFTPMDFKPLSERFTKDKLYTADMQLDSIQAFMDAPKSPRVICITGAVDDSGAKALAAMLVQRHNEVRKLDANVVWSALYGGFETLVDDYKDSFKQKPTMVVISNLTSASTNHRLERARDILDYFQDVPRIVVAAGEDPISFMAFRLRYEVHGIAYFSADAIKQAKVEVI